MPLSAEHKARTRARIIDTAARLFRERGYEGVGIKSVMEAAGLTHGGFYAHFESKAELLAAVLKEPLEFRERLERAAAEAVPLEALRYYLDGANGEKVAHACTLATLLPDAARATTRSKAQLAEQLAPLVETLQRLAAEAKSGCSPAEARAAGIEALLLCTANINLGRALGKSALRQEIEAVATAAVQDRFQAESP